jgi:hypothetical protein
VNYSDLLILGRKHAVADSDNESDDDLPSLGELCRTAPRPKIPTKAPKTEPTLQHLNQPALGAAGMQVDRTKSGLGDSPGKRTGYLYEEAIR